MKAQLREALLERRRVAARAGGVAASFQLALNFPNHLAPSGGIAAGYMAVRDEIDPEPLLGRLALSGVSVALPVTPPRASGAPLSFRLWEEGAPLIKGAFGILEPEPSAPTVIPDLIFVPLLGFDRSGNRLGYGQGHYDRTLADLRAREAAVITVGLAYSAQEVASLPTEPHDERLDWVLTERGMLGPLR